MATKKNAKKKTAKKPVKQNGQIRFAGYPSAQAFGNLQVDAKGKTKATKVKKGGQLPWGFMVKDTGVRKGRYEAKDGHGVKHTGQYAECKRRRKGAFERDTTVWIREHELQDERCLEVVFVDIGQGDGCFLVTPEGQEGKRMVIDAGEADNMVHYLNWRHGTKKKTTFDAGIISHPDKDHYKGFDALCERPNFKFKTIYTNGLMEYAVPKKKKTGKTAAKKRKKSTEPRPSDLGPKQTLQCDDGVKRSLVTKLVTTKMELQQFLKNQKNWQGKQFPSLLEDAHRGKKVQVRKPRKSKKDPDRDETLEERNADLKKTGQPPLREITKDGKKVWAEVTEDRNATMGDFRMLSVDDGYLPGYGKDHKVGDKALSIRVLGPVTDKVGGKPMLRWLEGSDVGKTKNGHSVVLRLQYGNVSMMLGGDLNIPAEHLLMSYHTGMSSPPDLEHESAFVEAARRVFQVDIAKSCHHGSADFTHFFLRALNPIATVISSGDNEPHSHPRSDTLGAIGHYSRSHPRPLIFSTELARSTKDSNQKPHLLRSDILTEVLKILKKKSPETQEKQIEKFKEKLEEEIPRSVAVYGAITVVTDGEKVIIYQKLESKGAHGEYDIYQLEPSGADKKGPLMYQSDH